MREEEKRKERSCGERRSGAQTFRRGRLIMFYEQLKVKQETLQQQLEKEVLQSIHPMLVGELKATEAIMNEFKVLFQLDEAEQAPREQ